MHSFRSISSLLVAVSCAGCAVGYAPSFNSAATPPMSGVVVHRTSLTAETLSRPRAAVVAEASLPAAPSLVSREAAALAVLDRAVVRRSHPEALFLAFEAYYNYRAAHPEQVRKPYLYFVDYGLDSREARGYIFDMDRLEIVEGPFNVAHGRGSLNAREGVPTRFSNVESSATTSLGLFVAEETYAFSGNSSGQRYRSIGLRMRGVSGKFNNAARRRGIVVHGAPYVTAEKAGRSEGCPAMEQSRADRLIPMIADGGMVFLFSPQDPTWLNEDPWISRRGSRMAANSGVTAGG